MATIAEELTELISNKELIRQAIISKGVDVPESELIDTYAGYIDQIITSSPWDPASPTLEGLKYAIDNDIEIPVGTEIPDTYDAQNNPLIVAQKLDSSNNSSYGGAVGTILIRKYATSVTHVWGQDANYSTSEIHSYLNSGYVNNCSNSLRTLVSQINVPYFDGTAVKSLVATFFLMSCTELLAPDSPSSLGIPFDYWKLKTNITTPTYAANSGRIVANSSGVGEICWLRSYADSRNIRTLVQSGAISGTSPTVAYSILPACFIAKG